MTTIARRLRDNEAALARVWGDILPPADDGLLQRMRAIVANHAKHDTPILLDSTAVGWAQGINPNRLADLASAYRATGDEAFAECAHRVYMHWLTIERFDDGYTPSRDVLTIPHRLGDTEVVGWFGALPHFVSSPAFDEPMLQHIVENARLNLNHLLTILHPARNIRMTQMDALLTQGLRLDWLADAPRWRDVGRRGLNDCFFRQFNRDGSSIEGTGWYHYIVANMAFRFLLLSRARPDLGLQVSAQTVLDAFDYTVAMVAPDGTFNRIGDSTAGVLPHKTLAEVLARRAVVRETLGAATEPPSCTRCFPDIGQALLRTSWQDNATYVTFDASERQGWHWHPARNAIQLQVGTDRLIADPGRMRYDPTPQRLNAVTTRAHSTCNLNGWTQSDAPARLTERTCPGYHVVTGSYEGGYWPLESMSHGAGVFGSHHRTLFWIHDTAIVVVDNLRHTEPDGSKPDIESNWQLGGGDVNITAAPDAITATIGTTSMHMLFALKPDNAQLSLHRGELAPCRGWIADAHDSPVPAPLLCLRVEQRDAWNTDMATILIPHDGHQEAPTVVTVVDPLDAGYGKVVLQWPEGTRDAIYWTPRLAAALDTVDSICTDAALVHVRYDADARPARVFLYEATYCTPITTGERLQRSTFVHPTTPQI